MPPSAEPAGLEPPTGRRAVRGPTAFVLGMMMLVALVTLVRVCAR